MVFRPVAGALDESRLCLHRGACLAGTFTFPGGGSVGARTLGR